MLRCEHRILFRCGGVPLVNLFQTAKAAEVCSSCFRERYGEKGKKNQDTRRGKKDRSAPIKTSSQREDLETTQPSVTCFRVRGLFLVVER